MIWFNFFGFVAFYGVGIRDKLEKKDSQYEWRLIQLVWHKATIVEHATRIEGNALAKWDAS